MTTIRLLLPLLLLTTLTIASGETQFEGPSSGFDRIRQRIQNDNETIYRYPVDHFIGWLPNEHPEQYHSIDLTPRECAWRAFAYSYMACNAPCEDFAYLLELVCDGDTDAINLPYLYTACCKRKLAEYGKKMDATHKTKNRLF